jgi:hypothetical protein
MKKALKDINGLKNSQRASLSKYTYSHLVKLDACAKELYADYKQKITNNVYNNAELKSYHKACNSGHG